MQNNNDIKKNIGWKTKILPFKNKVLLRSEIMKKQKINVFNLRESLS